jgi:UDP-galactopyranose mutase
MPRIPDLVVCLAHKRWSAYYDRSQELMAQCARERRVVFVEEPEVDTDGPGVELSETRCGVLTLVPHVSPRATLQDVERAQRRALDFVLAHHDCTNPVLWYYAPKSLSFTEHLDPAAIVYDWVDEGEHPVPHLGRRAQQLLDRADVVFTDTADHRQLVHHNVIPMTGASSWSEMWTGMWSRVERAIVARPLQTIAL